MSEHLKIRLTCVGDGLTAISKSLKLAKANGKQLYLDFPEGYTITIRPESCVHDLVAIYMLRKESEYYE